MAKNSTVLINNLMPLNFYQLYNLLSEVNDKSVLYHRSQKEFEPGDFYGDLPLRQTAEHEDFIEKFRKKYAPDKPSRLNCIYCSVVPRSVYIPKGKLYEVFPIGKTHTTLGYFVNDFIGIFYEEIRTYAAGYITKADETINFFGKKIRKEAVENLLNYLNKYWNTNVSLEELISENTALQDPETREETLLDIKRRQERKKRLKAAERYKKFQSLSRQELFKQDLKWIEVLCEKVQILKVVNEEKDSSFKKGDKVIFIKDYKDRFGGNTFFKGTEGVISSVSMRNGIVPNIYQRSLTPMYSIYDHGIYNYVHVKVGEKTVDLTGDKVYSFIKKL
jgi:hypothetical protein